MRTEDGKLAILDFGLMTEVTENQKYGMIEAIAHLISKYDKTTVRTHASRCQKD